MSESAQMTHQQTAPFIVLEGVDGSGKSTQVQLLASWLHEQGLPVRLTREPGGTVLAERLRALILDPTITCVPRAELLMLLAARAQHVAEIIVPALLAGEFVISDRFSLSTLAYQGYGRALPLDEIRHADAVATGEVRPSLTIILDVPLSVAIGRIGERHDRFEGEGQRFLQRVIEGYRQLAAEDAHVTLVDGTGSLEEVQAAIRKEVWMLISGQLPAGGQNS